MNRKRVMCEKIGTSMKVDFSLFHVFKGFHQLSEIDVFGDGVFN
jgi:hypothetical protein